MGLTANSIGNVTSHRSERRDLLQGQVVHVLLLGDDRLKEYRVHLEARTQRGQAARPDSGAQNAGFSSSRTHRVEHRICQQLGRAGNRGNLETDSCHSRRSLAPYR